MLLGHAQEIKDSTAIKPIVTEKPKAKTAKPAVQEAKTDTIVPPKTDRYRLPVGVDL